MGVVQVAPAGILGGDDDEEDALGLSVGHSAAVEALRQEVFPTEESKSLKEQIEVRACCCDVPWGTSTGGRD